MKVLSKPLLALSLMLFTLFSLVGCNQPPPTRTPDSTKPAVTSGKPNREQKTVAVEKTKPDRPSVLAEKAKPNQPSTAEKKTNLDPPSAASVPTASAFSLSVLGSGQTMQIPADIKGGKTALVFFSLT